MTGFQGDFTRPGRTHRWGLLSLLGGVVLLSVGGSLWMSRPFQMELGTYRTSLVDRTEAQRHNINKAVMALDGVIIEPGDTFSFNSVVGPRTPERGYREAPAFMERDLVTSIGGGICQVSSTVYNAAALAGLSIIERHPHFRRVSSVPPGRDATVWYGQADLRVQNLFSHPVRLRLRPDHHALQIAFQGHSKLADHVQILVEQQATPNEGGASFRVVRLVENTGRSRNFELLSLDVYRVN